MEQSLILSCEHATAWVPGVVELGVAEETRLGHLGWDPGAREIAAHIALALSAPLLLAPVSRLVVDTNRARYAPDVVASRPFGVPVPGNAALDPEALEARLCSLYDPWRRALLAEVERGVELAGDVLHLSVHTFTGVLQGTHRDVEAGVLFDPSRAAEVPVAEALLGALGALGLDARPNQPYAGTADGTTTWLRGQIPDPVYAGVELEIRQDLLPGWSERIADAVAGALREFGVS